jgi:outer membrane protein TolC
MNKLKTMKYASLFMLLLLIVFNTRAQQQAETKKFSLQDAVAHAKNYNNTLKNSALDVLAAEKKVKEVLASGLPNVNATGSFNNYIVVPSSVIDFGGQRQVIRFGIPYSATGSISASQLLFDGGFLMGVKASKEYVQLAKINLKRSEVETEVAVSKTYYGILLAQTSLTMLNANLDALGKTKFDLEKLVQNGFLDRVEFDKVNLQYSSLELQRDKLIDQQKTLMMVLKIQLGLDFNENIELTDDLMKMYETSKTTILTTKVDYNNRLEYQLVNQSIALNTLDKKRYQFGYAPSLVGIFSTQQNSFGQTFSELGNDWYEGTLWGLNLTIPIFDGFKKSAQIQQAKINIKKAENDKKVLGNAIEQEVFNAKTTYERSAKQLDVQKRNLDLAQDIYNRTELKFKNGLTSSLDLTIAQKDLETARASYLNTMYDYFVAQLDLRKALGDLNK